MTSRHLKGKLTPQHFYFMCASNFFHVDQITARIPVGLVAISRRRQHPLSIPVRADSCQRAQVYLADVVYDVRLPPVLPEFVP